MALAAQPNFIVINDSVQAFGAELRKLPNIPAIAGGNELLTRMDTMLERMDTMQTRMNAMQTQMNDRFNVLTQKVDRLEVTMRYTAGNLCAQKRNQFKRGNETLEKMVKSDGTCSPLWPVNETALVALSDRQLHDLLGFYGLDERRGHTADLQHRVRQLIGTSNRGELLP